MRSAKKRSVQSPFPTFKVPSSRAPRDDPRSSAVFCFSQRSLFKHVPEW